MSLAGPVLSIQPSVVVSSPLDAMQSSVEKDSLGSPQLAIPSHRRERANSENDLSSTITKAQVDKISPPSPLSFEQTQSLNAPTGSMSPAINRSRSIPRESMSVNSSLSPSKSPRRVSSRLMTRAKTIDTPKLDIEEFEDYTKMNQYKVLDIIGHGSYGIVRKAMSMDDDEIYAMKIVGKGRLKRKGGFGRPPRGPAAKRVIKSPLDNVKREIAILKKLNHPNVVRLFEVLDDPSEDDLVLVFEYIPNGPVIDKLPMVKPFSEEQSRNYFVDMILGIEYLHSQHVIHRDIKPMNLLLDDEYRVKIADFGVSEEIERSESNLSKWAGTPAFVAPECLDSSNKSFQGQPVDIWAAGITLFCFIVGKVPWSPPSVVELYELIKTEDAPMPSTLPPDLADLLKKLLAKDQKKRITIPEIRAHPWVLKSTRVVPSQEVNCNNEISVSEEDMERAVKTYQTPIHILAMIKQMAKKRSLRRPFSPRGSPAISPATSPAPSPKRSPADEAVKTTTTKTSIRRREHFAQTHNAPSIVVDNVDAESGSSPSHEL